MKTTRTLIALLIVLAVPTIHGQQPPPRPPVLTGGDMEDIEKLRKLTADKAELEKTLADLERVKTLMTNLSEERMVQCLGVVGHPVFCACIVENLPLTMDFPDYAYLLSNGRETFGYSKMEAEDKLVIDAAYSAREKCVQKAFRSPEPAKAK